MTYMYLSSLSLSLHVHVPLVTHSVYIPRKCWSKSYVPPLHYLVCTLVICIDYFVHFLLVGEPNFTCLIFHVHVLTLTYSVNIPPHKESFERLSFDLNSISTTYSWPSLSTRDFITSFVYLLLLGGLIFTYFMATCTSGDLLCTYTFFWWPILYTWNFLMDYYVHIPLNADLIRMYHLFMIHFVH